MACATKLRYFRHLNYLYHHSVRFPHYIPYNDIIFKGVHSTSNVYAKGLPIKMPSLSPTMMEGTIVKWLKKEGDPIAPGDLLCDIQTDKAVVSLETDEEGILAKILIGDDNKDIKVGTLIALMVAEGEDWKDVEMPEEETKTDTKSVEETKSKSKPDHAKSSTENYGPSVRLLLEKYGLSSEQIPASGPHGKLLKGDVLKFVHEKNLQPKPVEIVPLPAVSKPVSKDAQSLPSQKTIVSGDNYVDLELTNMRKTIAKRLFQSKSTIAHTYSTLDCCINNLLSLRKQYKKEGVNVSVNDFIIKSVSVALSRHPEVNCVWENNQLVYKQEIDISVAVATDVGLITPIVKGVERLGLEQISETVKELAGRAKENKLKLNEFQGGTFTISNLGMFGIKEFTAIINPPQCGILAVGGGRISLGVDGKPETRMNATLSYDQAAISDDTAAMFLESLKEVLENPQTIALGSYAKKVNHPMAALL